MGLGLCRSYHISAASNGHRYLLVATDYATKWVEAASLPDCTARSTAEFLYSYILAESPLKPIWATPRITKSLVCSPDFPSSPTVSLRMIALSSAQNSSVLQLEVERENAENNIIHYQQQQHRSYQDNRPEMQYHVGDLVLWYKGPVAPAGPNAAFEVKAELAANGRDDQEVERVYEEPLNRGRQFIYAFAFACRAFDRSRIRVHIKAVCYNRASGSDRNREGESLERFRDWVERS
ncbi:hypothetical protein R1flu_004849 [Riccia fluitans]|uniref:Uncharacterized protein n=1 Tax=Riccia fluitans TaxID=41844 RepID=A0ABD1YSA6_9MARC